MELDTTHHLGEIPSQDMVVSKALGQALNKYVSLFPHVSAAILVAKEGKTTTVGERVEYVYANARHTNPLNRVVPSTLMEQTKGVEYDKEKYREMLLEAAETVLGLFGFDKTIYGDAPKRKNRKRWTGLTEERLRDRDVERIWITFYR